jgi:hypothetical protein
MNASVFERYRALTMQELTVYLNDLEAELQKCNDDDRAITLREEIASSVFFGRPCLCGTLANKAFEEILLLAKNNSATNQGHIFVHRRHLLKMTEGNNFVLLFPTSIFEIPAGMVVSAEGFESWYGRSEEVLKGGRPSRRVIEDYATLSGRPPPVESMDAYLLEDGRLFFNSHNSHRVAAAIRRGDSHVALKGNVTIFALNHVPSLL